MNATLKLNGETYDRRDLLRRAAETHGVGWEQDFWEFVGEWLADADTVTVKTSGSTGTPKNIALTKKAMRNSAQATGRFFGLRAGDKALLCLPCGYIAGKMMVVRAFELGLDLWTVAPTATPLRGLSQDADFRFAAMIPLQVFNSLAETPTHFEQLQQVIIGGGVVDSPLIKRLQSVDNQCFATYGMTETITHVAVKRLNGAAASPFYEALENVRFAQDERGCLVIDAPHLSENQVITNDVVRLYSAQKFEWLGRWDNVINSGGVKISPEEVEEKIAPLLAQDYLDYFVAALPHATLGNQVVLLLEGEAAAGEQLWEALRRVLSKFELPKQIFVLPAFVRTETGKIQRSKTLALLETANF